MVDMPRPRPPHLHREISRHGNTVWYVRIGKGPRIRIRGDYGSPAFMVAYHAAIKGEKMPSVARPRVNTLAWLVERYRDSAAWTNLSLATRRQRENVLKHIIKSAGSDLISRIDRKAIVAGRDRRRDRPNAARHFVQTLRGLFEWAVEADYVREDPTRDLKIVRPATNGHHVWTEGECEAYERRWPLGTRQRVAYDVLLYTGLRRGDAVRIGRPHIKNGVATLRTEKTGEPVYIPILAPLQASLGAGPIGALTFITGEAGQPMKKESFGNWFREQCRAAGVPGSAHGLRKASATRAAQNGATVAQLEALFGWRGGGMASLYTREVDRARLAKEASIKMLPAAQEANIYSRTLASGAGVIVETIEKTKR